MNRILLNNNKAMTAWSNAGIVGSVLFDPNYVSDVRYARAESYIFIGGLIGSNQVGVETRESHYRPNREETYHHLQHSNKGQGRILLDIRTILLLYKIILQAHPKRRKRMGPRG